MEIKELDGYIKGELKKKDIWNDKLFVWFTIRADKTQDNENIQDGFKEYCKVECANDYTLGLKTLLEYKQGDWKYESLYMMYQQAMDKIIALEDKISTKKTVEQEEEEDGEVF